MQSHRRMCGIYMFTYVLLQRVAELAIIFVCKRRRIVKQGRLVRFGEDTRPTGIHVSATETDTASSACQVRYED